MDDSTKEEQTDGGSLTDQEIQALETILRSFWAFEQFQGCAHELHRISQTEVSSNKQRCLSDIEAEAKVWLETVEWAEAAGRLDPSCRFLLRLYPIERVHEERLLDGLYESDLGEINAGMEAIRKREGLDDDEYWPIGEGPDDLEKLEQQYEKVTERKFEETLREYGLDDIADLYCQDRKSYDAQREQGRQLAHVEKSEVEQLYAVQKRFEDEAEKCAKGGAYYAATVMIGSAMEAALLSACLKHLDHVLYVLDRMSNSERPRRENPKRWSLVDLERVAAAAGWLPDFVVGDRRVSSRSLVDELRSLRNLAHPAKHLSDPLSLDVESEYTKARAAYNLLERYLAGPPNEPL